MNAILWRGKVLYLCSDRVSGIPNSRASMNNHQGAGGRVKMNKVAGVASAETSLILMMEFCEEEHDNPFFFYPRASWNRTFSFSWLKEGC